MKTRTAVLLTAATLAAGTVAVAPTAAATICGGPGGERFSVEGSCSDIATDPNAPKQMDTSFMPYYWGEHPCYSDDNVPYFTPAGQPC